jgi:hypothetical protein
MLTARSYSVELTAPSTSPLMVLKIFLLRSILLTLSQDLTKYKSATGGVNPDGSSKSAEDIDFGQDPGTPPPAASGTRKYIISS